jgi:hypothetical protein
LTIFSREVDISNSLVKIYALPEKLASENNLDVKAKGSGYSLIIETSDKPISFPGKETARKITDEQSLFTILLTGEKRLVADEMVELTRQLRIGTSKMMCFFKGCSKDAVLYADGGKERGNWFACSKEHTSKVSSINLPLKEEDYKSMVKVK